MIPYAYTARMIPKIVATIMLGRPERRVPKNTKPTPGLCENGLPKLEIAISASRIAKIVRAAPRDFSFILVPLVFEPVAAHPSRRAREPHQVLHMHIETGLDAQGSVPLTASDSIEQCGDSSRLRRSQCVHHGSTSQSAPL